MKKVFISQPMRGLTDEEILEKRSEIKKDIETKINEEIEFIDSFLQDYPGEYYTFEYKSFTKDKVKSQVVASIFNKAKCKNVDWFELAQLYNDKINEYNQKSYVHDQYITDTILTEIYKLTR